MNFFEQQAHARTRSSVLVALFMAAVAGLVTAIYLVAATGLAWMRSSTANRDGTPAPLQPLWDPNLLLWVAVTVLVIVGIGTLVKISQLSAGGAAVAQMLDGREVLPDTRDPAERRLRNVVEEMAIAAGIPVPAVYVLDRERGMNAFAAGRRPEDAVVAVTRGLLDRLNRDELQGVVAHEFSHILNGDMRLNLRLMGVIYGILAISIIGRVLMEVTRRSTVSRRSSKGGQAGLAIFLGGLALFLIGYIGVLFGRMIQAAVSRQREWLADASAVQFTRNPGGIANALKRLGAAAMGGAVTHPRAEEASHLFFASNRVSFWAFAFATHPPLVERIRRIEPTFDGNFAPWEINVEPYSEVPELATPPPPLRPPPVPGAPVPVPIMQFAETMGRIDPAALAYARDFLATLPPALQDALRQPAGAMAGALALLLSRENAVATAQVDLVRAKLGGDLADFVARLRVEAAAVAPADRLPCAEVALGSLRRLAPERYTAFRDAVVDLIRLDGQIDLFEYAFMRVLIQHLDAVYQPETRRDGNRALLEELRDDAAAVLAVLARFGHAEEETARAAYLAGTGHLAQSKIATPRMPAAEGLEALDEALVNLARLAPRQKEIFVGACVACINFDGVVSVEETELLRAIAALLDCPAPPLSARAA